MTVKRDVRATPTCMTERAVSALLLQLRVGTTPAAITDRLQRAKPAPVLRCDSPAGFRSGPDHSSQPQLVEVVSLRSLSIPCFRAFRSAAIRTNRKRNDVAINDPGRLGSLVKLSFHRPKRPEGELTSARWPAVRSTAALWMPDHGSTRMPSSRGQTRPTARSSER